MNITEISIMHHIGLVMLFLWISSSFGYGYPVIYLISFIYLFQVNELYTLKLRKKLQFEERRQTNQRRLLSDSETVRWLNHAIEKVWPVCMEQIASQKILLPIIPWFLDKYKPWTARKAVVQSLYLGRNPPMFTEIRVIGQSSDDDHLVLELGMNFLSADDMSAILAVKLRKRLGFGIWAKMHVTGMHVEGKILVGIKFLQKWPFIQRLRLCFVEPPYFQMTVKPIFNHGLDVTEVPGIAGWLDKLLAVAFEQTLVEPNMMVVDVEKLVSSPEENWFSVDEKRPIAFAKVEIIEAADMKPSDPNGLADPYVKGRLGPYRFRTKTQKKTLTPKWQQEFKIPICTWESPNVLVLDVRDKDHLFDDSLGNCSINIGELRGGQRHDKWLPLQNIKMGRLHLAITVLDADGKGVGHPSDEELTNRNESPSAMASEVAQHDSDQIDPSKSASKVVDNFEAINIEGQSETGVWVHQPGNEGSQTWEPRRGKSRHPETQLHSEDHEIKDSFGSLVSESQHSESSEEEKADRNHPLDAIRTGFRKIGSIFHKDHKNEDHSQNMPVGREVDTSRVNLRPVGEKGTIVKLVVDNETESVVKMDKDILSPEKEEEASPGRAKVKDMAKGILRQAGKSAHNLKHAMSKKGSRKMKSAQGESVDGNQKSDSFYQYLAEFIPNEESTSSSNQNSPRVEGTPVDSATVCEEDSHESIADPPLDANEPPARKVSFGDLGRSDNDVADHADVHDQAREQSHTSQQIYEENLEGKDRQSIL